MPPEVGAAIGPYYVYALIDPRDDTIFYMSARAPVGGCWLMAGRLTWLLMVGGIPQKIERIKAIRKAGMEPRIDVMRHGIVDEGDAFMIEAVLIDCLGIENLTNKPRGHGSRQGVGTHSMSWFSRYGARPRFQ